MHRFRVAIPANYSDQLAALLRDNADLEAMVPMSPDLRSNDPMEVQSDVPMTVFLIHDSNGDTPVTLYRWLEGREDPQLDIRGEDDRGQFNFSFADHTLEEVRTWAAARSAQRTRPE